jgi:hypothetical protein
MLTAGGPAGFFVKEFVLLGIFGPGSKCMQGNNFNLDCFVHDNIHERSLRQGEQQKLSSLSQHSDHPEVMMMKIQRDLP